MSTTPKKKHNSGNVKKRKKVGIFGVKKSTYFGPFGKYAEDLTSESDSSDSDYGPVDGTERRKKEKRMKRGTKEENHHGASGAMSHLCYNDGTIHTSKSKLGCGLCVDIPIEILVKIFSYLLIDEKGVQHICRAARVCRKWSVAASDASLWKVLNLAFLSQCRRAHDKTILTLAKRFPFVEELNVSGWKKLTDSALKAIQENWTKFSSINIANCLQSGSARSKITSSGLKALAKCCNLTKIDFTSVLHDAQVLKQIVEKDKDLLTSINVSCCSCIGSAQVNLIQSNCRYLRSLDLTRTSVESINIEKLQAGCPELEELYLTNLNLRPSNALKSDQSSDGFSKLRVLSLGSLTGGVHISNAFLKRVLHSSQDLKILDLRGCTKITCQGLRDLPIIGLERLFMGRCTIDSDMLVVISNMWHWSLLELDISRTALHNITPRYTDTALKFSKLEILDLSGSLVTDVDVSFFTDICHSLEQLNLTSCHGVSRGIKRVHDSDSIHKLRSQLTNWKSVK